MTLTLMPLRRAPPGPRRPGLLAAGVPPAPQGQGAQVDLEGPQPRRLGPGAACRHAQAVRVVAASIFVPAARGPGCPTRRGRPRQGRGAQAPGRHSAGHLDHDAVDWERRPTDRPAPPQRLVLEGAPLAIAPGSTPLPAARPVHRMGGGGHPRSPPGPTALGPGADHPGMSQPGSRSRAAAAPHRAPGTAGSRSPRHRPPQPPPGAGWPPHVHGPRCLRAQRCARGPVGLTTRQPRPRGQRGPGSARGQVAHAPQCWARAGAAAGWPCLLAQPERLPCHGRALPSPRLGNGLPSPPARCHAHGRQPLGEGGSSPHRTRPGPQGPQRPQPGRVKSTAKGRNHDSHHVHRGGAWSLPRPPLRHPCWDAPSHRGGQGECRGQPTS
jgi:hypothetical protein